MIFLGGHCVQVAHTVHHTVVLLSLSVTPPSMSSAPQGTLKVKAGDWIACDVTVREIIKRLQDTGEIGVCSDPSMLDRFFLLDRA